MQLRLFLSTALLGFAIFTHAGCTPTCEPGFEGPYDNREGQLSEQGPHDWICVDRSAVVHQPYPDLGGDKPLDAPGPKDMDAVAKAAVFVESCLGDEIDWPQNVNRRIDTIYSTVSAWAIEQGISDRVHCFKDKANGCDAVRECLGMATVVAKIGGTFPCTDEGVGHGAFSDDGAASESSIWYDVWYNCPGLGLECNDNYNRHICELPREICFTYFLPHCTENNEPRYCGEIPHAGQSKFSESHPSCSKAGLTCKADNKTAYCAGSGPTCEWKAIPGISADFGQGIACTDSNTLRVCVNGFEQIVDCSAVAKGFHCIDGTRPHCGADFQCNYDRSNPLPTCNGTVLEVCNGGVRTQIDCTSLGFETCDPVRGLCGPIVKKAP